MLEIGITGMAGGESESCSAKGTRLFCSTTWLSCKMDWKSTIYIHLNLLHLSSGLAWSSAASTSARLKHLQPSCSSRVKGSMSFPSCNTTDQGKSTPQMVVLYTQITRTSSPQPLENLGRYANCKSALQC